jgi:hypothetical protein
MATASLSHPRPATLASQAVATVHSVLAGLAGAAAAAFRSVLASVPRKITYGVRARGATGIPDVARGQSAPAHAEGMPEADSARRQMERLAALIHASARRGERAARCHASAARRIDAAIYELEQLRAEIATVVR